MGQTTISRVSKWQGILSTLASVREKASTWYRIAITTSLISRILAFDLG